MIKFGAELGNSEALKGEGRSGALEMEAASPSTPGALWER